MKLKVAGGFFSLFSNFRNRILFSVYMSIFKSLPEIIIIKKIHIFYNLSFSFLSGNLDRFGNLLSLWTIDTAVDAFILRFWKVLQKVTKSRSFKGFFDEFWINKLVVYQKIKILSLKSIRTCLGVSSLKFSDFYVR